MTAALPIAIPVLGAAMVVLMTLLWLLQRRTGDAGVVDVGWTAGVGLGAVLYAWAGDGDPARRVLMSLLVAAWSVRLATYIYRDRVRGKDEDRRYRQLRNAWGAKASRNFLFFFWAQAVLVVVFSLPAWVVARHTAPFPAWFDALGAAVLIVSVAGEASADAQLKRFRAAAGNRGRTCRAGLWRYSRHPNYFFEWLHWWAYPLWAFGHELWWVTLIGPALMLFFLFKVTGIPATEAQALRSRGEDYRSYQQVTSVFIPWFPKRRRA